MRLASTCLALLTLTACSVETYEAPPAPEPPTALAPPPAAPPPETRPAIAPPITEPPAEGPFAEIVYLIMRDKLQRQYFCTGSLVSRTTVVTAAHCLEPTLFVRYDVVAPDAPNKPRVRASKPALFGGSYEDVANPDIGFLKLETPIELSAYAELTDVVARVEAGEALSALAVVRTAEKLEAPLHESPVVPVSSTVGFGYQHGFGTPMFSNGGDSGAGLFLVENGKRTHKLIGVARQPEPARQLDHFTRVDEAFLTWYGTTNQEAGD